MPISGLVITLTRDDEKRRAVRRAIVSDLRFTLGETFGDRMALVCETGSPAEDEQAWNWLLAREGVTHADLVSVDFSDVERFGEGARVLGMRGRIGETQRQRMTREEIPR